MSKNIGGRRTQKNILMIIAALVAVLAAAAFFLRSGWRKSTSGTRFFDTRSLAFVRGMHRDGGKLYCFDDDTYLLYGWISYRGGLYYSGSDGAVCTGSTEIDGHTYYFDPMSGRLVTGWETLPDGRRRYRGYDGVPVSGETTVDGAEFLFDSEGFPVCGFYTSSAGTRYYSESGAANGLCEIDGDVYFFTKYIMQTGICATPDGDMFFAPDGKRLTGLIRNGSDTLYAADDGILATGWQTAEGGLFYFTPAYTAAPDGFYTIDGRTYLFEGGAARLGWQTVGGKLYYFSADDGMYTGWRTVDGTEMLFSSSGELSGNGFTRTDGKTFYLRDGELLSGWQVINIISIPPTVWHPANTRWTARNGSSLTPASLPRAGSHTATGHSTISTTAVRTARPLLTARHIIFPAMTGLYAAFSTATAGATFTTSTDLCSPAGRSATDSVIISALTALCYVIPNGTYTALMLTALRQSRPHRLRILTHILTTCSANIQQAGIITAYGAPCAAR